MVLAGVMSGGASETAAGEVGRGEPAFGVLEELEELPSAAKL